MDALDHEQGGDKGREGGAQPTAGAPIASHGPNMGFLMDIPLEVAVELGRTRMMVKDLLTLKRNSLIELDREANEPVDILINNKPFAKGEVVIEGERIAIMVIDIVSPTERIQQLS